VRLAEEKIIFCSRSQTSRTEIRQVTEFSAERRVAEQREEEK
jgi:hypothetical protein